MHFSTTYFATKANGLFDFDLTILVEGLLFLLLAVAITLFFLYPLSKQLEQRAKNIRMAKQKSAILLLNGSESLLNIIEILIREVNESKRETKKNVVTFFAFQHRSQDSIKESLLLQEFNISFLLHAAYFSSKLNVKLCHLDCAEL